MNQRIFTVILLASTLGACGNKRELPALPDAPSDPVVGNPLPEDFVVRSRMTIDVSSDGSVATQDFPIVLDAFALGSNTNVTLVNGPNASMGVSTSAFQMPTVANALLDLGSLAIQSLFDNDLKVCGSNGKTKCNTALIRVYTAGVAGGGLWNSEDGYGAPLTVESTPAGVQTTGLGAANAVVVQSVSISNSQHVMRETNLSPSPSYRFRSDFTDMGAGSYSTTIVIEYGLTL